MTARGIVRDACGECAVTALSVRGLYLRENQPFFVFLATIFSGFRAAICASSSSIDLFGFIRRSVLSAMAVFGSRSEGMAAFLLETGFATGAMGVAFDSLARGPGAPGLSKTAGADEAGG